MDSVRLNILHRPQRQEVSRASETTTEKQYQREQAVWNDKAVKSATTHDRIHRSIYPTPADKEANRHDIEAHVAAQLLVRGEDMAQDAKQQVQAPKWGPPHAQAAAHVYVMSDQPTWTKPSLSYESDAQERAARRGYELGVAEANRKVTVDRQVAAVRAREEEQRAAQQALSVQGFWNAGSMQGRNPEQFSRPQSAVQGGARNVYTPHTTPLWASPEQPETPSKHQATAQHSDPRAAPSTPAPGPGSVGQVRVPVAPQWQPHQATRQYPWSQA